MSDIFISYNHKDQKKAFEIADFLTSNGLNVFIDRDLTKTQFTQELENEINLCKIFLLIASENAYSSQFVKDECKYAKDNEKEIIPYIIDNSKPKHGFGLMLSNYIQHNSSNFSTQNLSDKIKEILLKESPIPPVPPTPKKKWVIVSLAILICLASLLILFPKDKQQEIYNLIKTYPEKADSLISTDQQVDLGLSIYWSGFNIGAKEPYQIGNLYYWGEIIPISSDSTTKAPSTVYDYNNLKVSTITDAAMREWGNNWRIPSKAEMEELNEKCKSIDLVFNNCSGKVFIGTNGNCIFIPRENSHNNSRHSLYSTNTTTQQNKKWCWLYDLNTNRITYGPKNYAYSIRPVKDKE